MPSPIDPQQQCERLLSLMAQAVALETRSAPTESAFEGPAVSPLKQVLERALSRLEPMMQAQPGRRSLAGWIHELNALERELQRFLDEREREAPRRWHA